MEIFNAVRPAGAWITLDSECRLSTTSWLLAGDTPAGAALKKVLDEHIMRLDKALNTDEYSIIKPLDIILITSSVPCM